MCVVTKYTVPPVWCSSHWGPSVQTLQCLPQTDWNRLSLNTPRERTDQLFNCAIPVGNHHRFSMTVKETGKGNLQRGRSDNGAERIISGVRIRSSSLCHVHCHFFQCVLKLKRATCNKSPLPLLILLIQLNMLEEVPSVVCYCHLLLCFQFSAVYHAEWSNPSKSNFK